MNRKTVHQALDILATEGGNVYTDPSSIDKYSAIGMALTSVTDSTRDAFKMVYSFLEEFNHHTLNSLINYVLDLYPNIYLDELNNIERSIALLPARRITLLNSDGTFKEARYYRAKITFEEVK